MPGADASFASIHDKVDWISKRLKTLFVERQLPYRLSRALDRVLLLLGVRMRKIRVDGLSFYVRRGSDDEAIVRRVVEQREYLPDDFKIGPRDVVVDIGGNIGSFAVLAASLAREGRVFSYEPIPENYEILRQNLILNGHTHAKAFCQGVIDKPGKVEMFLDIRSNGGHSIKQLPGNLGGIQVDMTTLERILADNNITTIDFLKIDCEGAEFQILNRCDPALLSRVRRLAMEYHILEKPPKKAERARELIEFLESRGFRVVAHHDIATSWEGLLYMERDTTRAA